VLHVSSPYGCAGVNECGVVVGKGIKLDAAEVVHHLLHPVASP